MTGNPSLSVDYYRKVLSVEKKNKQAMAEMQISQDIQTHLEAADAAMENKEFHKVRGHMTAEGEGAGLACVMFSVYITYWSRAS